ncbi:MAG: SLOG family protein [Clostridia bacterium]|nr:SLOG family protein [Clostridia bacterium]
MKSKSVCFTGHRDIPAIRVESIKEELKAVISELADNGYTEFYAGGASGFDLIASYEVLELKKVRKDIKLKLILPYKKDINNYTSYDRYRQKSLLERADSIEYIFERYLPGCFHTRNRRLVDQSSVCIAFLEKTSGGTYYTVKYATEKGLKVMRIE